MQYSRSLKHWLNPIIRKNKISKLLLRNCPRYFEANFDNIKHLESYITSIDIHPIKKWLILLILISMHQYDILKSILWNTESEDLVFHIILIQLITLTRTTPPSR